MLQKTRKTDDATPITAKAKTGKQKVAPSITDALTAAETVLAANKPKPKQKSGCGCGW